jgi:hypothetical protein
MSWPRRIPNLIRYLLGLSNGSILPEAGKGSASAKLGSCLPGSRGGRFDYRIGSKDFALNPMCDSPRPRRPSAGQAGFRGRPALQAYVGLAPKPIVVLRKSLKVAQGPISPHFRLILASFDCRPQCLEDCRGEE